LALAENALSDSTLVGFTFLASHLPQKLPFLDAVLSEHPSNWNRDDFKTSCCSPYL
jgi:hypothetical protein